MITNTNTTSTLKNSAFTGWVKRTTTTELIKLRDGIERDLESLELSLSRKPRNPHQRDFQAERLETELVLASSELAQRGLGV